jgi:tryptophan synthase alpha chain
MSQPTPLALAFQTLKQQNRCAFIPFISAGDPDMETTAALIQAAAAAGSDIIEVGVPFSDPIADGPVIQAAYHRALSNGFQLARLFETIGQLRKAGLATPLVCMVSYTLVYKRTLPIFFDECKKAGFNGLIIPDLPAGYEGAAATEAAKAGLDLIFLIAPTTPPERRDLIAKLSTGFIYYISVAGITGTRSELPADLADNVKDVRSRTTTPVCVGFGISKPEQAAAVGGMADGVIVGSALVRKVEECLARGLQGAALVEHVNTLLKPLAQSAHQPR